MRGGILPLLGFLVLLAVPFGALGSTVQPVGAPNSSGSGCHPGGLFGHVAPVGNALVGILYPDPATQEECVLGDGETLPGDTLQIWMFTPNAVEGNVVAIGVEEFHWGTTQVDLPGPNGTIVVENVPTQLDVVWSNATIPAAAGTFQQFNLQVPAIFVSPPDAENLTVEILGLQLHYRIATPGTALPVAETLGGLIGWLALMSPAAVISFIGGFGPGQWFVGRLRYVSSGRWACFIVGLFTLVEVLAIAFDFTAFLYWLGNVGVAGLGVLLLVPCLLWGTAFWITVRGKRLPARLLRAPIAKTNGGAPTVGVTAVRIFGGGKTGHPEELVEGFGVGGPGAAWNRLLGLRIRWRPDKLTPEPRLIHYDWSKGNMDVEGEYAVWPVDAGRKLDYSVVEPEKIWFPWRKSVKGRFENGSAEPNGHALDPQTDADHDPALWAHRGFFIGLRHGDARAAALGSPDYVVPDLWIRGTMEVSDLGRAHQRRGRALILMNAEVQQRAEDLAHQYVAVQDRLQAFPGSPEAIEGTRKLATREMTHLFDVPRFMEELTAAGQRRIDYRPPGATKVSTSTTEVYQEALNPEPPELRGSAKGGRR